MQTRPIGVHKLADEGKKFIIYHNPMKKYNALSAQQFLQGTMFFDLYECIFFRHYFFMGSSDISYLLLFIPSLNLA